MLYTGSLTIDHASYVLDNSRSLGGVIISESFQERALVRQLISIVALMPDPVSCRRFRRRFCFAMRVKAVVM